MKCSFVGSDSHTTEIIASACWPVARIRQQIGVGSGTTCEQRGSGGGRVGRRQASPALCRQETPDRWSPEGQGAPPRTKPFWYKFLGRSWWSGHDRRRAQIAAGRDAPMVMGVPVAVNAYQKEYSDARQAKTW